jgi:hypothetical protein
LAGVDAIVYSDNGLQSELLLSSRWPLGYLYDAQLLAGRSVPVDEEFMNKPVDASANYSQKPKDAHDINNDFEERESLPLSIPEENL